MVKATGRSNEGVFITKEMAMGRYNRKIHRYYQRVRTWEDKQAVTGA